MLNSDTFNKTNTTIQTKLTLQTIDIKQIFTLLVTFNSAFYTPNPLSHHPPQQTAALETIRKKNNDPHHKIIKNNTKNRINQRL